MKKYLIAIALMLALGLNTEAASQKHRHSKVLIEQVDSAQKPNDAIEAFSDTTTTLGRPLGYRKHRGHSSHVPHCPAAHHLCDLLFRKQEPQREI